MLRELTSELRQFEGLATEFEQSEVLAWQVAANDDGDRVEIALLWGRTGPPHAPTGWALVQGFRRPDGDQIWRRSVYYRYLKSRLTHTRPGEDLDGTWHAYQHYDHAPTVREICDFAAVDFFNQPHGFRRVSRALRQGAWFRVAGGEPRCGFASPSTDPLPQRGKD